MPLSPTNQKSVWTLDVVDTTFQVLWMIQIGSEGESRKYVLLACLDNSYFSINLQKSWYTLSLLSMETLIRTQGHVSVLLREGDKDKIFLAKL